MFAFPELPFCQEPDGRWRRDASLPPALLCGAFNPLHAGHLELAAVAARRLRRATAFELTAMNADKPTLDENAIRRRLRQFEWQATVWLTRASTFAEKARHFPGTVFVVGYDTAERVLQPRFYGSEATMLQALTQIRELSCRFLVAGRMSGASGFLTIDRLRIPVHQCDLFDGLTESEFRVDLSATHLRLFAGG